MNGLGAATQNGSIAGFQAETGRLGRHIGTGLINNAHHAEGHAHFTDLYATGAVTHIADFTHRVRQRRNLLQPFNNSVDTRRGQRQTIQHRGIQTRGFAGLQIFLIGLGNGLARSVHSLGDRRQSPVFGAAVCSSQNTRSGAGLLPELLHVLFDVHRRKSP